VEKKIETFFAKNLSLASLARDLSAFRRHKQCKKMSLCAHLDSNFVARKEKQTGTNSGLANGLSVLVSASTPDVANVLHKKIPKARGQTRLGEFRSRGFSKKGKTCHLP